MTSSLVRWGGVIGVRPLGLSMSAATPFPRAATPSKRGKIKGWSRKSAARHVKWLQSVQPERLTGHGYGVTLTVRSLPEDAKVWARLRREWVNGLEGLGLPVLRGHWVTEWQRRGHPHLHAAVYFDRELTVRERAAMVLLWVDVAASYGAASWSQRVDPIHSGTGWARYLAKHSARSAAHFQRSGMPQGWESSGRLWGHFGEWPTETNNYVLNAAALVQLRRLIRSFSIAQARSEIAASPRPNWKRLTFVRGMLSASTPERAAVRGITEWVPSAVVESMLDYVATLPGCVVGRDWYDLLSADSALQARGRAYVKQRARDMLAAA